MVEWTNERWALCEAAAARHGVSAATHPDDFILRMLFDHKGFKQDAHRIDYYFDDGASSALKFSDIISEHLPKIAGPRDVLEFASGYGCVTRHLITNPSLRVTTSDIHPQANDFLRSELGTVAVQSSAIPEQLEIRGHFDAVFALSFFSHMPLATWTRWLVRLMQATSPGGILVLTTHGVHSRHHFGNPDLPDAGFWFTPVSEQKDLPAHDYGQTVVTPAFVREQVRTIAGAELLDVREANWWGHQDLYVLRRHS